MFVEMLIPALAIFVAAAFRGITGFGFALIAAIGLSSTLAPNNMIPTILINDLLLTGLILSNRKTGAVDWSITPILLICGALGALFGGLLAGLIDPTTTKLLVAVVVCMSALLGMVHEPPRWLAHRLLGASAAFVVGVLLAAFAVGGPLIAVWLLAGGTRRETTLGTLAVFFGAVDLFSVTSRLALDQYGNDLPLMLLYTLPITLVGYGAGHLIGSRLSHQIWRRVSSIGLILIALAGALQTLAVWLA
ncbi:hypothetical protein SAMN04515647_1569 [Cohaesibacter sp. ES.047]|uniref:sulfite exporter TauE/SafE family protein n=1 Tax=Cohaesibacter sp. ES.047 TaxID=1798205 RepID=UPI000BB97EA6|nr:sulfite exporter TauE/SafE family protein [Cohaesibacter sp. ES.047]SNY91350.1 hypothetical protein SAMN04515647_1569 [Cohaesibacter sp. ES.047]